MKTVGEWCAELFDSIYRIVSPSLAFLCLMTGSFLTYDFDGLKITYPNWSRPIDLIVEWLPLAFVIVALTAFALGTLHVFTQPSLSKMKKKINDLKRENEVIAETIRNVFDGYLFQLSRHLDFNAGGLSTERVTIYIHDNNGSFIPFGRYSANPEFSKLSRTQYPDNEGCIAQGWANNWHFENALGRGNAYVRNNRTRYNMPDGVTINLNMRSYLYAVKRINDGYGHPLAVIVVESTDMNRYDSVTLRGILEREEGLISELITKLRSHIPELSYARNRGF